MKQIKKIFLIVLLLPISLIAMGEEPLDGKRHWTLEECIKFAVENSYRTHRQQANNSIYKQDYKEAVGDFLPNIGLSSRASFSFGRGLNPSTNTYYNINTFSNSYDLSGSLVLFSGFSKIYRLKLAKVNKLKGVHELEYERNMIAYDIMEAFFTALYNSDLVEIAEQRLAESTENLNLTKRKEELGLKGAPDVVEFEAKVAGDRYQLTKAQNNLTIALIQLKEKMNLPIDEELSISTEDNYMIVQNGFENTQEIYEISKTLNPQASKIRMTLEASVFEHKASRGSLFPTISASGGVATNFYRTMDGSEYAPFKEQFKNNRGEYVGFSLSVPIFYGLSKNASYKRSKARLMISKIDHDEQMRQLYSEIEQAVADMYGQADQYEQAVKQREAKEIAYDVNKRKYEEGLISVIDLHNSSNEFVNAQAEELNAKYLYYMKSKLVNYYKGESLYDNGI